MPLILIIIVVVINIVVVTDMIDDVLTVIGMHPADLQTICPFNAPAA